MKKKLALLLAAVMLITALPASFAGGGGVNNPFDESYILTADNSPTYPNDFDETLTLPHVAAAAVATPTDGDSGGETAGLPENDNVLSEETLDISTLTPGSGPGWMFDGILLMLQDGADIVLTGNVSNGRRVEVSGDVQLTLNNVSITGVGANLSSLLLAPGANLALVITGTNTLTAGSNFSGIHIPTDASLTIDGEGSLNANGGSNAAGIGFGNVNGGPVTINSGTVSAGASWGLRSSVVIINDGNLTFTGYNAGILGGNITINGGSVSTDRIRSAWGLAISGGIITAGNNSITGNPVNIEGDAQVNAIAIGGEVSNAHINIGGNAQVNVNSIGLQWNEHINISNNASVTANARIIGQSITIGGESVVDTGGQISAGNVGIIATNAITIGNGAQVTATGNLNTGWGYVQDGIRIESGTLNISDNAVVIATGGAGSPGIGGGSGSVINIGGNANVTAVGQTNSAGIGGRNSAASVINIGGNAVVTATGGAAGAGIGGGQGGAGGTVTIGDNAYVTATAGNGGAGIGGGNNGGAGNITISGEATVSATAIGGGMSIGRGNNGPATGRLTITGSPAITVNRSGEIPFVWFDIHPQSASILAGNTHTLHPVMGTHITNNLTFQWFSNTTASNVGGTAISGATSRELTVPDDLALGAHHYFVEVRAQGAFDIVLRSDAATVTVVGSPIAPQITSTSLTSGNVGESYGEVIQITGTQPITWSVTAGTLPAGLSLGTNTGIIYGIPMAAGTFNFTVQAANSAGEDARGFTIVIELPDMPPAITTASLQGGIVGVEYSQTLAAAGTQPITWSITDGDLPWELDLDEDTGVISGIPWGEGDFAFTVVAANEFGEDERQFTITIEAADEIPPTITVYNAPDGTAGVAYSFQFEAEGTEPIEWHITDGELPDGLYLDTDTGIVSGTPAVAGIFEFDIQAVNFVGADEVTVSVEIFAAAVAPTITTTGLPGGTIGQVYSQTLAASGTAPITWSIVSGSLPAGLGLNAATGVISGTPAAAGDFDFTVRAANAAGDDERGFSVVITSVTVPPVITGFAAPSGRVGASYSFRFTATGNPAPTWSHTGDLPPGLNLSPQGLLSGTPTQAGSFAFTVIADNGVNPHASREITVVINEPQQQPPSAATLTVVTDFANPGGTATVRIRLDNNPGFAAMVMRLSFSEGLTLTGYEMGHPRLTTEQLEDLEYGFTGPLIGDGDSFMGWSGRTSDITLSGALFTLTFDVSPGAEFGDFLPVEVFFENNVIGPEMPENTAGDILDIGIVNGGVRVREARIGDANGNGQITSGDGTVLARHLAGHNVAIDLRAVDMDNDGTVDGADLVWLVRWLLGRGTPPAVQP